MPSRMHGTLMMMLSAILQSSFPSLTMPVGVHRDDFGAHRPRDDLADLREYLLVGALLLRKKGRIRRATVDDPERCRFPDLRDVRRVDEEFHGSSRFETIACRHAEPASAEKGNYTYMRPLGQPISLGSRPPGLAQTT